MLFIIKKNIWKIKIFIKNTTIPTLWTDHEPSNIWAKPCHIPYGVAATVYNSEGCSTKHQTFSALIVSVKDKTLNTEAFISSFAAENLLPPSKISKLVEFNKNNKPREVNLHTFVISHSPVNNAFLTFPCLYYIICHPWPAIRDYHQSRIFGVMLAFYAILSGELSYAILAQNMQCWLDAVKLNRFWENQPALQLTNTDCSDTKNGQYNFIYPHSAISTSYLMN